MIEKIKYKNADPTRLARYVKLHPHKLLNDYDYAIWIDANVIHLGDWSQYVQLLKKNNSSLGLISHPLRQCFYEEADACKQLNKDNAKLIDHQVKAYREAGLKKGEGLYETNFMVVGLKDSMIKKLFSLWWKQIIDFSKRDQLGLAGAMLKMKIDLSLLLPKGLSVREDKRFVYISHYQSRKVVFTDRLMQFLD